MSTPRKLLPVTQDIDGQPCFIHYNPTLYRRIPNFEPQEGDIIEVSYPRSGTHWVQQIVQLILSKGESPKTYSEFRERKCFLEKHEVKATESPRLLITHFPLSKLRLSEKAKYIYVARNPWDCCVSCYHITREMPATEFANGTFDEFLDAFLDGQVGFGDYFDHVISGYGHRNDSNMFFVTYEELQRNKSEVVLRLAKFLGDHHRKVIEKDDDVFQKVLQKSTLEFMKDIMNKGLGIPGNNEPNLDPTQAIRNRKSCETSKFPILRRGVVGDCKQHFTSENFETMRAAIKERTKESDIMNIWQCISGSVRL